MSAYCLQMHAEYGCRHSGACCTAGWDIPVEAQTLGALQVHFGDAGNRSAHSRPRFLTGGLLPDGAAAIVANRTDGRCVFFEEERGRLCEIHRVLGPGALPSACRHFPRVVMQDRRGTFVTLSHFCPTAADLLFTGASARRVVAPPSLTLNGAAEGLDATTALPPVLRPGMLTDLEGYDAWEQCCLELLNRADLSPHQALNAVETATTDVERWTPGRESMAVRVDKAFTGGGDGRTGSAGDDVRLFTLARASVPATLRGPEIETNDVAVAFESSAGMTAVVNRYLAARLFGNWIAYYARRLRTVVHVLRVHLAALTVEIAQQRRARPEADDMAVLREAIRATDLLLVHRSDTRTLVQLIERRGERPLL